MSCQHVILATKTRGKTPSFPLFLSLAQFQNLESRSISSHSSRKFSRHLIFIEARAGRRRGGLLGKKVGQHWHSEMESEVSSRRSLFQGCPPPSPEAGDANYSSSCEQFVQPIYLIGLGPLGYLHLQRIPLGRVMWDVGN